MKQFRKLFISFLLIFTVNEVLAKDYFVLSSSNVKEKGLDKATIKKIFLGNKLFWDSGERILPVHLPVNSKSFKSFLSEVVNMDSAQFLSYWRRKLFSGRAHPPKQLSKDDSIIKFIQENPEGIGVISNFPKETHNDIVVIELD
jgi:ABC-type phosphate transport system substrate-binding protein